MRVVLVKKTSNNNNKTFSFNLKDWFSFIMTPNQSLF